MTKPKCTLCGGPVTVHKGDGGSMYCESTRSVFDNIPAEFVINLKEQLELKDKQLEESKALIEELWANSHLKYKQIEVMRKALVLIYDKDGVSTSGEMCAVALGAVFECDELKGT